MQRILIALDETEASDRAIEYTGQTIGGRSDVFVHVIHVEVVRAPMKEGEPAFIAAREKSRAILNRVTGQIGGCRHTPRQHGLLDLSHFFPRTPLPTPSLVPPKSKTAVPSSLAVTRCQWYREMVHRHPADELVKNAHGMTFWIVA